MVSRVLLVRHGDEPADDRVVTWLNEAGYEADIRKPFAGEMLGNVDDDVVGTVIYGGMYNAYDEEKHPFLNEEYRWIGEAIEADIPVLGICQGAQMIARHLGANVGPRENEIFEFGYYRIDPTTEAHGFLDAPLWVTQAHFHTFDIPEGAVRLAGNDSYENQAFRYGNQVYGLQFHAEVTIEGFRRWQSQKWDVYDRAGVQKRSEQDQLMYEHDAAQAEWFYGFLDKLFGKSS